MYKSIGIRSTPLCGSRRLQPRVSRAALPSTAPPLVPPTFELDKFGVERMKFRPEGHNYHTFDFEGSSYKIGWVKAGDKGSPVLLVHGFGASQFHWRYNIPELAKTHQVYAIDMLGFGLSEKAIVDYSTRLWTAQMADFIENVIGEPVVIAGNSLGGFVSLATAAERPDLVRGAILLNAAGRFEEELDKGASARETEGVEEEAKSPLQRYVVDPIFNFFKRVGIQFAFINTKRPERIKEVLLQVYHLPQNVDEDLVKSIQLPAQDPNAAEVFYRVINMTDKRVTVNSLLRKLDRPILLLWGSYDPWIKPAKADLIQKLYPSAERVDVDAGHCPHDDNVPATNTAMVEWIDRLDRGLVQAPALQVGASTGVQSPIV